MELNTRTKVAGGVLALALAALIFDNVVGSGPASAQGAAPADNAPIAREKPRGARPAEKIINGALAARLAELDKSKVTGSPQRDAFVAPVAWFPPDPEAPEPQAAEPQGTGTRHELKSVIESKSGATAVIDGKPLKVGVAAYGEIDGRKYKYELVRAGFTDGVGHAVVRINGKLVRLTTGKQDRADGGSQP